MTNPVTKRLRAASDALRTAETMPMRLLLLDAIDEIERAEADGRSWAIAAWVIIITMTAALLLSWRLA